MKLIDTVHRNRRPIGRYAWVMAWVGLVVGQLHALARFATEDGKEDLEYEWTAAWAVPAAETLAPLLEWADPYLVYVHYGKIWAPVFLAFFLCGLLVRRERQPRGFEKWAWRIALLGYGTATVGVTTSYWTQWTSAENVLLGIGFGVGVIGLLLTLLGSSLLGAALLLRRFRPVVPALLLLATFPLAFLTLQVTSMGGVALPVMFAFGILGLRIAREDRDPSPEPSEPVGSEAPYV
jgi:hypothetical protein